jgi:pimeloyl-ACP methyl ester carboxylesterase
MIDPSRTIVFVNGAWMSSGCWNDFRRPFEAAGYQVHTLEWPFLEGQPDLLRRDPPKSLGALSLRSIVAHHAAFIRALPQPPLIIGHSFGGLFVQMLLDQGLGWAGIAIDPAPIGGIIPGPITLMAALPIIMRIGGWRRPYTLTRQAFGAAFANTAPAPVQDEAYERLVVPTSGLMFYENALWIGTFVKPGRRTQPLLITTGGHDRTVSPYVAQAAYRTQKRSQAPTHFLAFPGMSHFLIAEPGWEMVAAAALEWAERAGQS